MSKGVQVTVLEPGYADYETEGRILAPLGATVTALPADAQAAPLLTRLSPVAILVREAKVPAQLMDACPDLKAVVRYGIGVDNIDMDAARRREIYVANVPDYGAENEVSDHAVGLYLAVARRLVTRDAQVRAGSWDIGQTEPILGHRGATLGLIGFGRIARKACEKFRALGFGTVLVSDPALDPAAAEAAGVALTDTDDICRKADLISLHTPLLPETRHIIDAARIRLMKPTAILINVSRGGLVDEQALAEALQEGRLFGAGVDVFDVEPPQRNNPLLTAPNTVLSDHMAWYSEASVRDLQTKAAKEVARVLNGVPPANWVNAW